MRIFSRNDELVLMMYDIIGEDWLGGISSRDVVAEIESSDARTITVRLNSGGGDVFEGIAIYQALARHPSNVVVHVDALAASIASVIAMAGDEINIAESAMMMIHNPWSVTIGDQFEHQKTMDVLSPIRENIAAAYAARAPDTTADEFLALMDAETWLTAAESVALGLAGEVTQPLKAVASVKIPKGKFRNTPAALLDSSPAEPVLMVPTDGVPAWRTAQAKRELRLGYA